MRKEDEQTDSQEDREKRIVDEGGSCTEMDVVAVVFRLGEEEVVVAGKFGGAAGRGAG